MNIQTVQIDGKMPNLALLKLRAHHRSRGDVVNGEGTPDLVYISCIFAWNRSKAYGVSRMFPDSKVMVGGSGVDLERELPQHIEHALIDWAAEGMNYAIGFSSRGCIRRCPFCIVPEKEGDIHETQTISAIANNVNRIVLLDNNFLASPYCMRKLNEIRDNDYAVNFSQGLDIRLINEENAKALKGIRYYNWRFLEKQLYFAWDNIKEERQVIKGIERLTDAGIPHKHLTFYILCGYDSTLAQDIYRVNRMLDYGIHPFVMVYNNAGKNKEVRALARWANRRVYKSCSWEDYRK